MELTHIATREGRLSSFLREEMKISTGLMNRLKWRDSVFVNGVPRHTDFPVQPGDLISIPMEDEMPAYPPESGALTVLYEDDHFLAVEKPAGMLIHPSRSCITGTLANRVIAYYQQNGQLCAFHPITRLDRDTFGIVLLAKNSYIHARMQHMSLQKTYHALVFGGPTEAKGIVDAPIARRPLPSLLREIREDGKPSVTEYRVMERFDAYSKLALRPITGRTHQLRLHCSYMGFPILGDPQYGNRDSRLLSDSLGLTTQLLCAKELEFTHPISNKVLRLESQMDVQL